MAPRAASPKRRKDALDIAKHFFARTFDRPDALHLGPIKMKRSLRAVSGMILFGGALQEAERPIHNFLERFARDAL